MDIGAHIGHYTILSSMRVGPNGKVVAVESHGGNFDMLNRNVKLNSPKQRGNPKLCCFFGGGQNKTLFAGTRVPTLPYTIL